MGFKSGARGINKTGKTVGKEIKMAGGDMSVDGGVAKGNKAKSVKSIDMKKMGRNMARAMNQKG